MSGMWPLWLCIAASWLVEARISVDNSTHLFMSSDGRVRVYHGVNVVQKSFPWHPSLGDFDAHGSLNRQDMLNLREWGFNCVRLGVMWPGVEPTRGVYNLTYLAVMRGIVAQLEFHGISTIVDFHQDVLAQKWCGEGVPGWLHPLLTNSTSGFHNSCDGVFPAVASVFGVCVPFSKYNISVDHQTGYPNVTECLNNEFSKYYETPDVSSAWQQFYTTQEVLDAFVGYWSVIATAFKGATGVIGYNLINEPYPGDVWHAPGLLQPGAADRTHLTPLYTALHNTIHKIDPDVILLYEATPVPDVVPPAIPWFGGVHPVGFEAGPAGRSGAAEWSSKQALSYHIYSCGFSGVGCTRAGDLPSVDCPLCDVMVNNTVTARVADVQRLGGGVFITEFGACTDSDVCVAEITRVTERADASYTSWAYWQFKYFADVTTISGPEESFYTTNGTLQMNKLKALSRTYCPVMAGTPISMRFETESAAFRLKYTTEASATRVLPTEIYLNEQIYYPSGYDVRVLNASVLLWPFTKQNQIAVASSVFSHPGLVVDVVVAPKYSKDRLGGRLFWSAPPVTWEVFDSSHPQFSLLAVGEVPKEVRVFGDAGNVVCSVHATSVGLHHCDLVQADWHGLLFDYRIELWYNSSLVHTFPTSQFGPLVGKKISFGWL